MTLNEVYDRYKKPMMIVENGLGAIDILENHTVKDLYRIKYLSDHLSEMRKAVESDGVNLFGCMVWADCDIISASSGEMKKWYGFIYVDDKNNFRRIKKGSFYWYKSIISSNVKNIT
ncbi:family 1 glycosylhydrolase [Enterococcus faecalis]|uniref:family 1 glycosylhydrolase n=1 Tax=Enterococcus TaxID=1350 RepID=UPI00240F9AB1|nr:family 1 glycosylhydrolase [Enterococcus faecalis]MDN3177393.1 family 1 glycosylhydrolase [Enterococcus faecalis]